MKKLLISLSLLIIFSPFFPVKGGEPTDNDQREILKLGYLTSTIPIVDIKAAMIALELWSVQISENLSQNMVIKSQLYNTMDEFVSDLRENKLTIISLPSILYLQLKDGIDVTPVIVPARHDSPLEEYIIVVNKDATFGEIGQLKDKKIIIQGDNEKYNIAKLWLDNLLLEQELPRAVKFFADVKFENKASKTILPVFFGSVDAAVTTRHALQTMMELNPQVEANLRTFETSGGFLTSLICINNSYMDKLYDILVKTCINLDSQPKGRQIMTLFQIQKLIKFDPADIAPLEQLMIRHHTNLGMDLD